MQLSLAGAIRFIDDYQSRYPLTIGELWAFPTMLRIACLEIVVSVYSQLLPMDEKLGLVAPALNGHDYMDEGERGARAIATLIEIGSIPWSSFFDATSLVERILSHDPAGAYTRMDFASRSHYRTVIEDFARHGHRSEIEIAEAAVARSSAAPPATAPHHIGYWLMDFGRREFAQAHGVRRPIGRRLRDVGRRNPNTVYFGLLILLLGATLLPAFFYLQTVRANSLGQIASLFIALLPASLLAVQILNAFIGRAFSPRVLAKIDLSGGLPPEGATAVTIPVVIGHLNEVAGLVEQMERHWLSCPGPNLSVVLLADFTDADEAVLPDDQALEEALSEGVNQLNARYGDAGHRPFHLLLRPRQWNESEQRWLAWERKRGKLEQFNGLVIDGNEAPFVRHVGESSDLNRLRYVVTVDAESMIPPGTVNRLVGAMLHPLNRAAFDGNRVVRGYSLIQPRIEILPGGGPRTLFQRIFAGDTAIDIYSRAVSDVYQDLFGTGIFIGKGIYDIAAFHRSLDGRVPENAVLSHDLFEGALGRVALASDILVYEGFPSSYTEHTRRLHRWIRGDWQLLPWVGPLVPGSGGRRFPNRLPLIERWKMLDNLRRSLILPSILLLAIAGWFVLPGSPWFWTLLAAFAPSAAFFIDLFFTLTRQRSPNELRGLLSDLTGSGWRWLMAVIFALNEGLLALHAISRTLWRLFVTRRHMLEWTSAAHVAARLGKSRSRTAFWRDMKWSPIVAVTLGLALAIIRPDALPAALLLLIPWAISPEIAYVISRPPQVRQYNLTAEDKAFLLRIARKTWYFFETTVTPQDNWLPPDNYQGPPFPKLARRTSPTNIGMGLLSAVVAWRLGFIGRIELAARTANSFTALRRMTRYRGHFLNWYDTATLTPLEPRYISTVDSGNLATALIALAGALRNAMNVPDVVGDRWDGLVPLLELCGEGLDGAVKEECAVLASFARGAAKRDSSSWPALLDEFETANWPRLEAMLIALPSDRCGDTEIWRQLISAHLVALRRDLSGGEVDLTGLLPRLAEEAVALADEMEFAPLYDRGRRLFHIGYNVSSGIVDNHFYDLLATEARLASYHAIAKGEVPIEHWFRLGRPVIAAGGHAALMSWNGSMFEYLMPRLLLRPDPESLLGNGELMAVEIQKEYGRHHRVPWGISESAWGARDPEHNFRYHAFGVPRLGLRRGLDLDMVVAPYASMLAVGIDPDAVIPNLRRISEMGGEGPMGYFDALDFTADRAPPGGFLPVNTWMAHHQGMAICAIGNALEDDMLVDYFMADPRNRLVSMLLSERLPRLASEEKETREPPPTQVIETAPHFNSWDVAQDLPLPQPVLLGNGSMASLVSDAGGGGLSRQGIALTRFRADPTLDADGLWIYLHDEEDGKLWSPTAGPVVSDGNETRCDASLSGASYHRRNHDIVSSLEVVVSARNDAEIRRLTLVNDSDRPRRLRITSYGEPVLAPPAEDERHPAFAKLFVRSEHVPEFGGQLFVRRPRRPEDKPPVLLHFAVDADGPLAGAAFEGDRRAFIGRGRTIRDPAGARGPLGGSQGFTLDAVMALQQLVEIEPYSRTELCFVTLAADSAEEVLALAADNATLAALGWAIDDAGSEAAQRAIRMKIAPEMPPVLQTLASLLLYPHHRDRKPLVSGAEGQPGLWGMGISGDVPILVLEADEPGPLLANLLSAHLYWSFHGFAVDLVILQSAGSTYVEPLREELLRLMGERGHRDHLGGKGGVHLVFRDQVGEMAAGLLHRVARVVLQEGEELAPQLATMMRAGEPMPPFAASRFEREPEIAPPPRPYGLLYDNDIGGFAPDGSEYVIYLAPGQTTPAPWCNILANERFGTLVSESGGGFSWAGNSGEYRLTCWTNDPVSDRPSETVYLRDEELASIWSVTPGPAGRGQACLIRHGIAWSSWRSHAHGIEHEQTVTVDRNDAVKLVRLRLTNRTGRHRRITATYYAEWLLGALGSTHREHVQCEMAEGDVLLASNSWNPEFAEGHAFLVANVPLHGFTTDRHEFLGRDGNQAIPAGLRRWGLSGTEQSGGDSCGVYQVHIDLEPGETGEAVFILGHGATREDALALAAKWSGQGMFDAALGTVADYWQTRLGAVTVHTPDPAFDAMTNHWLLYQSLSSRILARSGFYQSSGAYGFRDQLQDVLALIHIEPERVRAHIRECAAHQFEEGDVLHWWHPPLGRGVRTHFSDDLVWLPYAVATFVAATGDTAILEDRAPYLTAPELGEGEHDRYALYPSTAESFTLRDHCERALRRAMTQGIHGLPLIGTGDWNDGMDRVGDQGRGESVWLGWFLTVTLEGFAAALDIAGDIAAAENWRSEASALRQRVEAAGWDGAWYRRAYDDEGRPLGAYGNAECRIDSISQSWALFAGADPDRVTQALESAWNELVMPQEEIARLLTPPFSMSESDPGYIMAYPPGIRENGGQYTHAAIWLGMAMARSGRGDRALRLFNAVSPVARTSNPAGAHVYLCEPYVVAADIAAVIPHVGRGGWTWYTGSASWAWRFAVEEMLGLKRQHGALRIEPSLPQHWGGFNARIQGPSGAIALTVEDPLRVGHGEVSLAIAGQPIAGQVVDFPADGSTLKVIARISPLPPT